jgi:hypothetical protein
MDQAAWRDPEWLRKAHDWVDGRLADLGIERTGDIEQPHVRPWSTVLRVPASTGVVWFKANAGPLRHEAAVVSLIAARRPELVPPLLAADVATGWMLMADAGETLRAVVERERSLDRWFDVLPHYADLQVALAGDVDDLLAMGVPDMRLATLPQAFERLLDRIGAEPRFRAAAPAVASLCEELASYRIPETLQHDDLHDGQVFVRDGRHLVLDWADACVSHPFFTLSVTLEGGLAWGLDDVENSVDIAPFAADYLRAFPGKLAALQPALRLGWVCRAINGHVGDDDQTRTRLRMFLDGRPV